MIDENFVDLSVRKQCSLLELNRSGLYYQPRPRQADTHIANELHEIWMEMPFYGYRRLTAELQRRGYDINHKRVSRLMKEMALAAIYPRPKTSRSNAQHRKYPYLLKGLVPKGPDHVWATDITYIKLDQGFAYLVAIIDLYSRYIVSWKLSNTLDTQFCLEMLDDAFSSSKPEILNTDQGCQFTSEAWVTRVLDAGIQISMDGKGRWADNVFIERFWRTLKYEHVYLHAFETMRHGRESIGQFIDLYNHKRLHQSLNYLTPGEVYRANPAIKIDDKTQEDFIIFDTRLTGAQPEQEMWN